MSLAIIPFYIVSAVVIIYNNNNFSDQRSQGFISQHTTVTTAAYLTPQPILLCTMLNLSYCFSLLFADHHKRWNDH